MSDIDEAVERDPLREQFEQDRKKRGTTDH